MSEIKSLSTLLQNFNFVTVMNVYVYKLSAYGKKICTHTDDEEIKNHEAWQGAIGNELNAKTFVCYLDTLKISNITQSAPKKEFNIGKYNIPLIRWGKTVTMDITDALGNLDTLQYFFGLQEGEGDYLYANHEFAEPLAMLGEAKISNSKGELESVWIFIPCFVPKGELKIVQDADSGVGVFDLNGTLYPASFKYGNEEPHMEFYSIHSQNPFGEEALTIYSGDAPMIYSGLNQAVEAIMSGDHVRIYAGTDVALS